jgi:hypothetical protein
LLRIVDVANLGGLWTNRGDNHVEVARGADRQAHEGLTERNYNPVVVANHRLYARAFLDYLAECDIQSV